MKFSIFFLFENLADPVLKEKLKLKRYISYPHKVLPDQAPIIITGMEIISIVEESAEYKKHSYKDACDALTRMSSHWNRTKFLNATFELIMNYLDGLDKPEKKRLSKKLFNEEWFRVLFVLRNNASHHDNYGKQIEWSFKEEKIQFQGIIINKNDIGHKIRYNDAELFNLLEYTYAYFIENRAIFS